MAYVEVHYHQSYALEVREFGEYGWAAHVYAPRVEARAKEVAIVTTTLANGLEQLLAQARAAVDSDLRGTLPV